MLSAALLLRISFVVCWTIASSVAQTTGDGADRATIPPTFFGLHVNLGKGAKWPPVSFGALGKGAGVNWAYVEPSRGVFNWYGLDRLMTSAEVHGADVFYALGSTPQWASSRPGEYCYRGYIGCAAPPAKIEYWNEYVTAVVTRYKGRIRLYELWDEANASPSWSGTYEELVELARNAYQIIKSIDPDAIVLTPATVGGVAYQPRDSPMSGVDEVWIERYLMSGGRLYADAANWHGYLMRTAQAPYRMPEDAQSQCHIDSWNYSQNCSGSILDQIDTLREVLDRNGMKDKPIINSEGSWGNLAGLDPSARAAWLARYYLLQAGRGIQRVYWYGWNFGPWGPMNTDDDRLNMAGIAYSQIYRWLVGATVDPCLVEENQTTWTCHIARSGGYEAVAVWDTSGDGLYYPDAKYVRYADLAGNVDGFADGVQIGSEPILLGTGDPPL
jgi:hypothetical protein